MFQDTIVRFLGPGIGEGNSVFSQGRDPAHPTVPMPQIRELKFKEEIKQVVGKRIGRIPGFPLPLESGDLRHLGETY